MKRWTVYVLRCRGGALYTGATSDLDARLETHRRGQGSKYVRSHLPFSLVWSLPNLYKQTALLIERYIKHLSRQTKIAIVVGDAKVRFVDTWSRDPRYARVRLER